MVILCNFFAIKKYKVILTTHIDIFDNIKKRTDLITRLFVKKTIYLTYKRADSLVFVSKRLAEQFLKYFNVDASRISVIYNGIDSKFISKPIKHSFKKEIVLTTIARLEKQKDYENLLNAVKILQKRIKKISLWILSNGKEKEAIENQSKKIGLTNIFFFGWVSNIYDFLKKSDIFVFSSKREGFGYVLVEAMSQGLPVVSTNTNFGPSEILNNGEYGMLVPVGNEIAFAEAVYDLVSDKKLYRHYSQKSIERAKYFSKRKMIDSYGLIIRDLIKKK